MNKIVSLVTLSLAAVISGCIEPNPGVLTGYFIDASAEGICYETETQTGCTDSAGTYTYQEGERITFYIGNVTFPNIWAQKRATPLIVQANSCLAQNITPSLNCPAVINMTRLLQSLDDDGDYSNGIKITDATVAATAIVTLARPLYFSMSIEAFEADARIKYILENGGGSRTSLIGVDEAIENLANELQKNALWYADSDLDGYGDPASTAIASFDQPQGYVINNTDCDDSKPTINPDSTEAANRIDDNCNGTIDEGFKYIFVTSQDNTGDFGQYDLVNGNGLTGADNFCQSLADDSIALTDGLPEGTYKAWLSTDAFSVNSPARHSQASVPYVRYDGSQLAVNWSGLVDGSLDSAVLLDEQGGSISNSVWTGTTEFGNLKAATVTCNQWTAGGFAGNVGFSGVSTYEWTSSAGDAAKTCEQVAHLYCVQQ